MLKWLLLLIISSPLLISCSKTEKQEITASYNCKGSICSLSVDPQLNIYVDQLYRQQKFSSYSYKTTEYNDNIQWYGLTDGDFATNDELQDAQLDLCPDSGCTDTSNPTGFRFASGVTTAAVSVTGDVFIGNVPQVVNLDFNLDFVTIDPPMISSSCNNLRCSFEILSPASGGQGVFTYAWYTTDGVRLGASSGDVDNGHFSYDFTADEGTSVYAIASDEDGNESSRSDPISILVEAITAPSISYSCNNLTCEFIVNSQSDGGLGPYTYTWHSSSLGELGTSASNVNNGIFNYTFDTAPGAGEQIWVVANDVEGDGSVISNILNVDTAVVVKPAVISDGVCSGLECVIYISDPASSGTPPYTYEFFNNNVLMPTSSTSSPFTLVFDIAEGGSARSITVVAIDADGDRSAPSTPITVTPDVVVSPPMIGVDCDGNDCDFQITQSAKGGVAPYTYSWSVGDDVHTTSESDNGRGGSVETIVSEEQFGQNITVVATDSAGTAATDSQASEPIVLTGASLTVPTITVGTCSALECPITIDVPSTRDSGSSDNISYNFFDDGLPINNSQIIKTDSVYKIVFATAGTHIITAQGQDDETGVVSAVSGAVNPIAIMSAPVIAYTCDNLRCTFDVLSQAEGAVGDITYTWTSATDSNIGTTTGSETLEHTYSSDPTDETVYAIASDANNTSPKSNILNVTATQVTAPTILAGDTTCDGLACLVNIGVAPSGGDGPYTYRFFKGDVEMTDIVKQATQQYLLTFAIEDAGEQQITAVAVDAGGDESVRSSPITLHPEIVVTAPTISSSCDSLECTFTIVEPPTGGTPSYTYNWYIGGGEAVATTTESKVTHTITADDFGKELTVTATSSDIPPVVSSPDAGSSLILTAETLSVPVISNIGICSGLECQVEITTLSHRGTDTADTADISYSFASGGTTIASSNVTHVSGNTYSIAFDTAGDHSLTSFAVDDFTSNSSSPSESTTASPFLSTPTISSICNNLRCTFSVTTPAQGGTDPITYKWTSSTQGANFMETVGTAVGVFEYPEVPATQETVSVIATDANGLSSAISSQINVDPTQITAPTIAAGICTGLECTVSITTESTGGTPTYTYRFIQNNGADIIATPTSTANEYTIAFTNTDAEAGLQSITAIGVDSDGDESLESNSISLTPVIIVTAPSISSSCDGLICTFGIVTQATGGSTPYTYKWSIDGVEKTTSDSGIDSGQTTFTITAGDFGKELTAIAVESGTGNVESVVSSAVTLTAETLTAPVISGGGCTALDCDFTMGTESKRPDGTSENITYTFYEGSTAIDSSNVSGNPTDGFKISFDVAGARSITVKGQDNDTGVISPASNAVGATASMGVPEISVTQSNDLTYAFAITNLSDIAAPAGSTFEWYVDNSLVFTGESTSYTFPDNNISYTVKLVIKGPAGSGLNTVEASETITTPDIPTYHSVTFTGANYSSYFNASGTAPDSGMTWVADTNSMTVTCPVGQSIPNAIVEDTNVLTTAESIGYVSLISGTGNGSKLELRSNIGNNIYTDYIGGRSNFIDIRNFKESNDESYRYMRVFCVADAIRGNYSI